MAFSELTNVDLSWRDIIVYYYYQHLDFVQFSYLHSLKLTSKSIPRGIILFMVKVENINQFMEDFKS